MKTNLINIKNMISDEKLNNENDDELILKKREYERLRKQKYREKIKNNDNIINKHLNKKTEEQLREERRIIKQHVYQQIF